MTEVEVLAARLAALELRLDRLEGRPKAPANPTPSAPPLAAKPLAPPPTWKDNLTEPIELAPGTWLGLIGIVCLVLAAGFLIKLSIDSGWLTPVRQIGLAFLFGMSLVGVGLKLLDRDRAYASFLPGAGIIVIYASVFAAHRLYGLIPFEGALALTTAVSAFCVWLYGEIEHDVYPLVAAVGSYVGPVILGLNAEAAAFTLYYYLLCSLGFAAISVFVRSRALTAIASYLAIMMSAFVGGGHEFDGLTAVLLPLHFAIFAVGTFVYSQQTGKTLSEREAWTFFPGLLLFYAIEYSRIIVLYPVAAPWISLGFAALLFGLYLTAQKQAGEPLPSRPLILAFGTVVAFHSVYLQLIPDDARAWLLVPILLAVAFGPRGRWSSDYTIPAVAVAAIVVIEFFALVAHLYDRFDIYWLTLGGAVFASLWLNLLRPVRIGRKNEVGNAFLGAAHVIALLELYRVTIDYGSLAVSTGWLLYGLGVIAFAFPRRDATMAKSALLVLGFAAGKALLVDASSAPTVVRILCLLVTGAALYGAGLLLRRIEGWNAK